MLACAAQGSLPTSNSLLCTHRRRSARAPLADELVGLPELARVAEHAGRAALRARRIRGRVLQQRAHGAQRVAQADRAARAALGFRVMPRRCDAKTCSSARTVPSALARPTELRAQL